MIFSSFEFIFLFLPITWFLYSFLNHSYSGKYAVGFLVVASLFFYGYWHVEYLLILLVSITGNFLLSRALVKYRSKKILLIGVGLNLGGLGYYKYADFLLQNIDILGMQSDTLNIVLPLAISFFTFQQISFLVDTYQSKVNEKSFLNYCLFVSFFPQLIAGPIVHHSQMLPQFSEKKRITSLNLEIGFSFFALGLFKKVFIADGLSPKVTSLYTAVENGTILSSLEAWGAIWGYSFQLYFDFSGYADMAIGIALLFGIKLPVNFNSPYKAISFIEFWRRWHITLSIFLRDYLYILLGGNRLGQVRRYTNLFITMLLGGLWHGAAWNFILWGGLHGILLSVNHLWSSLIKSSGVQFQNSPPYQFLSWFVTFVIVSLLWVFFRASSLDGALSILNSAFNINTLDLSSIFTTYNRIIYWMPVEFFSDLLGFTPKHSSIFRLSSELEFMRILGLSALIAFLFPKTYDFAYKYKSSNYMIRTAVLAVSIIAFLIAVFMLNSPQEFIYFDF